MILHLPQPVLQFQGLCTEQTLGRHGKLPQGEDWPAVMCWGGLHIVLKMPSSLPHSTKLAIRHQILWGLSWKWVGTSWKVQQH